MSKISTLERKRFSILTNDLKHCYICGKPNPQLHEIYYGVNRKNSMKYGCVVPLCLNHHTGYDGVHNKSTLDKQLKIICQKEFKKVFKNRAREEIR